MKKVLIIDSHQLFRDFLKNKLSLDQIEVTLSQQNRDGYTKMISTLPNLVIMDMGEDNKNEMDLLEKKASDINTVNIPVIIRPIIPVIYNFLYKKYIQLKSNA